MKTIPSVARKKPWWKAVITPPGVRVQHAPHRGDYRHSVAPGDVPKVFGAMRLGEYLQTITWLDGMES